MILIFGSFMALLLLGVPIGLSLLAVGLGYLSMAPRLNMMIAPQQLIDSIDSFPLLAVPFFLLAGALMNEAGVTQRLVEFARTIVGHIRGGLAHTTIMSGVMMAGGSGSGTADAAALGTVMIPVMERDRYATPFAVSVSACAGALAPIIPPSIMFILYGHLGNVSVGQLFIAGIVPGLLFAVCLMTVAYVIAVRSDYGQVAARAPFMTILRVFGKSLLDLLLPVIIMGGIMGGVFTPTEAGAVAVVYVLLIGTLVYRSLSMQGILLALKQSVVILGSVMLVMAAAGLVQFILALMQAGQLLGALFREVTENPLLFLLLVNALLLALGAVLEVTAVLILMTPILMPVLALYSIDPVHFGVVMAMNLAIGLLTPPVGLAMYVTCAIGRIRIEDYTRAAWPFLLGLFILLLVVTFVPQLSLWLPSIVGT